MSKNQQPIDIQQMAEKWAKGKLTQQERDQFEKWYADFNDEEINLIGSRYTDTEEIRKAILNKINAEIYKEEPSSQKVRVLPLWPRIVAAASILLFLSIGGYFLLHKHPTQQTTQNQIHDIAPGGNKAILKLANRQRLMVTDAKNGLLAQLGNTTITKIADGQITYKNSAGNSKGVTLYDTLIVPRGGQQQVKFADGSIAYLNADTKLRIPENFRGSERTVELISGEADFHVVHNAKMPFIVKVKGQITKDIGTEFNINAYSDEPLIKTTLLEGSVKISKSNQSITLKPGQQAVVQASLNNIKVNAVDTDEAFAWKNGKFLFSSMPLGNIMRQLSRWYDVNVVYQNDALKAKPFSAISTRSTNVSQVLHDLELTGEVKFKIEGKIITVLNK